MQYGVLGTNRLSATVDLSGVKDITIVAGVERGLIGDMTIINQNAANAPGFIMSISLLNYLQFQSRGSGTARMVSIACGEQLDSHVITGLASIHSTPMVNLHDGITKGTMSVSSQGTGNYSNSLIRLGQRTDGIKGFVGKIFCLALFTEILSAENLALVKAWVAARSNVSM